MIHLSEYRQDASVVLLKGPMFAGKTAELISRVRAMSELCTTVVLKHALDTIRYPTQSTQLVSRTGDTWEGVHSVSDLRAFSLTHAAEIASAECIAIDEVQFFDPDQLVNAVIRWRKSGKTIIMSGLNSTSTLLPWPTVSRVEPFVTLTITLQAVCAQCGAKALYSYHCRGSDAADEIAPLTVHVVQADSERDTYEPRCLECFTSV